MRQHDLALAPARPASKAAESLCTGRARYGGVRRRTTAYFFFERPRTSGARDDGASFFSKTSHERGALRRRIFFFRRPRTSGARYDGASFFFRRPRTSGARYDGASFFSDDLARAGRATTAHLFFYDPRSSEGGNELDAQSPTTPHPHAHVCYPTASSTTAQSDEPRSSTFCLFFLPPKQYGYFAAGESHRQARPQCQRITQDSRLDVKSQSYHLHDGEISSLGPDRRGT